MNRLETERLILRPFEEGDYPLILKISSDPDTTRYLYRWGHPGTTPESDVHRFLSYSLGEWAKNPIRAREYCIVLKETGETMGDGSVEYWLNDSDIAEIGWILIPEHRGKGYATEMGRELLRFAFDEMGVDKVVSHCDALNIPSYRVMERLGMHLEKIEKECRPSKVEGGLKGDEMTWAISRAEWQAVYKAR